MKLEELVCSLELAKKLKELGVKQESLFWWVNGHGRFELHDNPTDEESLSAFTVVELGEILTGDDGERYFTSYPSKVSLR